MTSCVPWEHGALRAMGPWCPAWPIAPVAGIVSHRSWWSPGTLTPCVAHSTSGWHCGPQVVVFPWDHDILRAMGTWCPACHGTMVPCVAHSTSGWHCEPQVVVVPWDLDALRGP